MLCLLLTVWIVKVGLNCIGSTEEEFPVPIAVGLQFEASYGSCFSRFLFADYTS